MLRRCISYVFDSIKNTIELFNYMYMYDFLSLEYASYSEWPIWVKLSKTSAASMNFVSFNY